MDILKHTIHKDIYDLCSEIEKLPASEQQTKVAVMAATLHTKADQLVDALRDALLPYRRDEKTSVVTDERIETWKLAAEVE